ncbi:MAG: hypothetical protein ABFQ53_02605 [Patescibacteria group bacterium]
MKKILSVVFLISGVASVGGCNPTELMKDFNAKEIHETAMECSFEKSCMSKKIGDLSVDMFGKNDEAGYVLSMQGIQVAKVTYYDDDEDVEVVVKTSSPWRNSSRLPESFDYETSKFISMNLFNKTAEEFEQQVMDDQIKEGVGDLIENVVNIGAGALVGAAIATSGNKPKVKKKPAVKKKLTTGKKR